MNHTSRANDLDVPRTLRKLNHYQRLGLKTNAVTPAEIENAFRSRLALFHSVDAQMSVQEIDEADRLIQESFAILQDRQLRRGYDRWLVQQQSINAQAADTTTDNSNWSMRYQLGKKIAESERSQIFRAVDTRLNRQVIVKQLRPELVGSQSHDQLFREQAAIYAGCNSGKLVTILDYDVQSGSIVMEMLSQDLSTAAPQYAGNFEAVRDIVRDVLQGLTFLHNHGIAHGRIELQDLLLDNMGGVKLAITPGMTGSATALRPSPQAVHVAPEMLNSIVFGQPDLAIDVYALGFIALELLCGKRLAQKVSPTISSDHLDAKNWLLWHSSPAEHLPAIASIVRGIPDDLAELLHRMTSKQQDERFRSAKECLEFMVQRREAQAVATTQTEVIEVDEGVEIFGTPPALHQSYQSESSATWKEIVRDPKLLLKPRGRKNLKYAAVGGLVAASMIMLLVQPSSIEANGDWREATSDIVDTQVSQVAEVKEDNIDAQSLPTDADQAVEVPELSSPLLASNADATVMSDASAEPEETSILEEPIDMNVQDDGVETNEPMVDAEAAQHLAEAEGSDSLDPYTDVRGKTYTPIPQPFGYCSETDPAIARLQIQALRNLLEQLKSGTHKFDSAKAPYALPNRVVDPRVSFAMALWAQRTGARELAIEYGRKSIRDAMALDVPFVLPLQFLNHLHLEVGEFAPALAECRSVCQWIAKDRLRTQHFEPAGDEVAWWIGTVTGFLQHGKELRYRTDTDIPHTIELLDRLSSRSQFEKFRIAQLRVHELYADAAAEWDKQQANRETLVEVEDTSNSFVRKWFERRYFGVSSNNFAPSAYQNGYEPINGSLADEKPASKTESKPRMKRVRHPVTASSPRRFSTYHACDVTAYASQTLYTLSSCEQAGHQPAGSPGSVSPGSLSTSTRPIRDKGTPSAMKKPST